MKGRFAVFGATSGIARAVSRELAARGCDLLLIGRNGDALKAEAQDLKARFGRDVPVLVWDLLNRAEHPARFRELVSLPEGRELTGLFFAPGVLFREAVLETDPDATRLVFDVNLTETVVVLGLFAAHFRDRKTGVLSVLSSVAGDRGRARQKTYGASKAGLSAYLEGLRSALHKAGVLVQTVKPGPVRTPMTAGYKGPAMLLASPEQVAHDIVNGIARRKATVYTPGYWRWAMALLRALPEFLARRVPA